jgi:hypothetical protein
MAEKIVTFTPVQIFNRSLFFVVKFVCWGRGIYGILVTSQHQNKINWSWNVSDNSQFWQTS